MPFSEDEGQQGNESPPKRFMASLAPLTYDPAIYWLLPYYTVEQSISLKMIETIDERMRRAMQHQRDYTVRHEALESGWSHYAVIEQPHTDDLLRSIRTLHQHIYELPGYTKISCHAGPFDMTQFRLAPQGSTVVELDLRPLMYHGQQARGALYDNVLYVVEYRVTRDRAPGA